MSTIIPVYVNGKEVGEASIDINNTSVIIMFDKYSAKKLKRYTPIDIHINYG